MNVSRLCSPFITNNYPSSPSCRKVLSAVNFAFHSLSRCTAPVAIHLHPISPLPSPVCHCVLRSINGIGWWFRGRNDDDEWRTHSDFPNTCKNYSSRTKSAFVSAKEPYTHPPRTSAADWGFLCNSRERRFLWYLYRSDAD